MSPLRDILPREKLKEPRLFFTNNLSISPKNRDKSERKASKILIHEILAHEILKEGITRHSMILSSPKGIQD